MTENVPVVACGHGRQREWNTEPRNLIDASSVILPLEIIYKVTENTSPVLVLLVSNLFPVVEGDSEIEILSLGKCLTLFYDCIRRKNLHKVSESWVQFCMSRVCFLWLAETERYAEPRYLTNTFSVWLCLGRLSKNSQRIWLLFMFCEFRVCFLWSREAEREPLR